MKIKFSQARSMRRQILKNGGQTNAPAVPVRDPKTGEFPPVVIRFSLDSRNGEVNA